MPSGSFQWRGEPYRLERSTWYFWGHARLIQLPGQDGEFRMTPDDALFIRFALQAGCEHNPDTPEALAPCQAFLEHSGHRVWTVQAALAHVHEEPDTECSARLMDRLIEWFFIARC